MSMKNRQHLTIKQVNRLTEAGVDLSGASALWMSLEGEKPMAVSIDFARFMFLPDTIKENTICPAPTLSDCITLLPSSLLTENNLRYLLTLQSAMTSKGVRYKAAYCLQPFEGVEEQEGIAYQMNCTCKHDNPLDAIYELIMGFVANNEVELLNKLDNGDNA